MDSPLLLHVANVIYLASYSVRDMLWLRILTVIAMVCLGWYYLEMALFTPLGWQAVFLSINLVQIWLLVYERRPVKLTDLERKLHEGPLRTFTPLQLKRFTDAAEWATLPSGRQLVAENSRLESLILMLSGRAVVRADGRDIATIEEGHFAGEMSFLTGGNTTAAVIADGVVKVAIWRREYIDELAARDRDLAMALQAALGINLVEKVINRQR
jgi:hypothetical protein